MSKAKKTTPTKVEERLIYCGPNIPGGVLQQYTVYKNGYPKHLNQLFKNCPAIKKLFVPIKQFGQTEQAIKKKGTPQNMFYNQVLDFYKKGGA